MLVDQLYHFVTAFLEASTFQVVLSALWRQVNCLEFYALIDLVWWWDNVQGEILELSSLIIVFQDSYWASYRISFRNVCVFVSNTVHQTQHLGILLRSRRLKEQALFGLSNECWSLEIEIHLLLPIWLVRKLTSQVQVVLFFSFHGSFIRRIHI